MKRREFLKTGAMVVVGTAAAASGLAGLARADQATPKLTTLTQHQADTLLKVAERIFPHRKIGEAPYWRVVGDLDSEAKSDPATAKLLAAGVEQLDGSRRRFADLDRGQQTEALKAIEATPFFQKVRSVELQNLYSDPAVWKSLGYEGPAYKFGGYVHRGFNDLAWLPDPPESASPKFA